jgi:hypothetical protein
MEDVIVSDLPFWKTLKRTCSLSCGKVYKTDLTITIPKDPTDAFWTNPAISPSWQMHGKCYEFVVTRYGDSAPSANWRATTMAIEIIRCARNGGQFKFPQLQTYELDCPVYELGHSIHNLFRVDKPPGQEIWNKLNQRLDLKIKTYQESIGDESQKCILLLLKYYKVHSKPFCPCFQLSLIFLKTSHPHFVSWVMLEKQLNYSKRSSKIWLKISVGHRKVMWIS